MARLSCVIGLSAWLACGACGDDAASPRRPEAPEAPAPAPRWAIEGDADRGRTLIARFECNRCHEGTGLDAPPPEKRCVGCHVEILEGRFEAPPETLARWQSHITSLVAVPSLGSEREHLSRDFVYRFLLQPHDVRPNLVALMPRLNVDERDARDLATHLVPVAPGRETVDRGGLSEGRRLLEEKGCTTCHAFDGVRALGRREIPVPITPAELRLGTLLAPDLRHTRDRMTPAALLAWLADPRAVKPDTAMPSIPLAPEQVRSIAAYVLYADLAPRSLPPAATRLPLLEREVAFDEVRERVFHHLCWHCHSDADFARGDGGPGNTGGFGFAGRGINLAEYRDIMSGHRDRDGERRSLFERRPDGTPFVIAVLLQRHREMRGEIDPELRGMPLGLPPLPLEEIQLVDTWIAQGRPE